MPTFATLFCFFSLSAVSAYAQAGPADERPLSHGAALKLLEAEARETYPSIRAARDALEAAGYGVDAAKWAFFPTPQVTAQADDDEKVVKFRLTQPLWTWGRLSAGEDQARARRLSAEQALSGARLLVSLNLIELYGALVGDLNLSDVYRAGLKDLADLREMMRRRAQSQVSAQPDSTLADARYASVEDRLFAARSRLEAEYGRLSDMVGREVTPRDTGMGFETSELAGQDQLVDDALAFDPEIARLQAEVEVADGSLRVEKSSWFPTVFVRGERDVATGRGRSDTRIYLGLESALPAGLGALSRVRAARSSQQAARQQVQVAQSALRQQMLQSLAEYRSLNSQVGQLSGNVERLDQVLSSYKRLFLLGKRSWLDVLNMVREGIQTREALEKARVRLFVVRETLIRRGGQADG